MNKKRGFEILFALSMSFIMSSALINCGGGGGSRLSRIYISPSDVMPITVGATQQFLAYSVYGGILDPVSVNEITGNAAWTSSNEAVATVNKGLVTGVAPGTATITATFEGFSAGTYLTVITPPFQVVNPTSIAIDASGNAWVTNYGINTITKLSVNGAVLGTFPVGIDPYGIAIDASGNAWVTNYGGNTVTELSSNGAVLGTFPVGNGPRGIHIDAAGNVWVANHGGGTNAPAGTLGNTVTKLSSNGAVLGTFPVGNGPWDIAIDASGNVWVTNSGSDLPSDGNDTTPGNTVTKLSSNGAVLGTFPVGMNPYGIAIDASGNAWVTNYGSNTVTELSVNGAVLGTFPVVTSPHGIVIDNLGHAWVTEYYGNSIEELDASGGIFNEFAVGNNAESISIDNSGNVWVANYGSGTVTVWKGVATAQFRPYPGPIWP